MNEYFIPKAPTEGWELGQMARATSTGEEGKVVTVHWDQITILCNGRRLRFPVSFMEKIESEEVCQ